MLKILVVDDEKSIRLLYQEELADEGYDVVTAESGHRLLEKIEEEGPDLIVLDIKMMEYNGLDLLQDIRNKYYNLPVILCSAYEVFKQDIKAIAADAYVVKSSDLTQLKRAISRALEGRRADLGKGEG